MNKEYIFTTWAPDASGWSPWVKPVLFACLGAAASTPPDAKTVLNLDWAPAAETRTALILDLPGPEGVLLGLALAERGYRPVPVYNAVPLPSREAPVDLATGRAMAAVDVLPILTALEQGAEILANLTLPNEAPPAFLLDANRQGSFREMMPDEFDNRSICFTTDFPSANFLFAQGIRAAVLVQSRADQPQSDLAQVLRRWQDAGILIQLKRLDKPGPQTPCEIERPSWFGAMFQRALAMMGLRRGAAGGFGGWVPDLSAGG